jgi:phosphoserine phosphatase
MTRLLETALSQAAALPDAEQDAVAAILLAEMASEKRWSASFAKSQDMLAGLAQKALAEHAAGKTQPL